jgi:hypothetical protein
VRDTNGSPWCDAFVPFLACVRVKITDANIANAGFRTPSLRLYWMEYFLHMPPVLPPSAPLRHA